MQFNGIGRSEHGAEMHHVTECMHDHSHFKKEDAGASGTAAGRNVQMPSAPAREPEGMFSLSAWLDRTLGNGKRLLRGFWDAAGAETVKEAGERSGEEQLLAQIGDARETDGAGTSAAGQEGQRQDMPRPLHAAQIAQASAAVQPLRAQQETSGIPAEAKREAGGGRDTLWQRIRVKFRDAAGQLKGRLPGKFFSPQTNSFQMKQEKPREDMRRQGKARRDAVEIDSYRMDESYLLDSYDRKGSYSRLTTKK